MLDRTENYVFEENYDSLYDNGYARNLNTYEEWVAEEQQRHESNQQQLTQAIRFLKKYKPELLKDLECTKNQ